MRIIIIIHPVVAAERIVSDDDDALELGRSRKPHGGGGGGREDPGRGHENEACVPTPSVNSTIARGPFAGAERTGLWVGECEQRTRVRSKPACFPGLTGRELRPEKKNARRSGKFLDHVFLPKVTTRSFERRGTDKSAEC